MNNEMERTFLKRKVRGRRLAIWLVLGLFVTVSIASDFSEIASGYAYWKWLGKPGLYEMFVNVIAEYEDYRICYYRYIDNPEEWEDEPKYRMYVCSVEAYSEEFEAPLSGIKLGSTKSEVEKAYRFNETEVIDGDTYYKEPLGMTYR